MKVQLTFDQDIVASEAIDELAQALLEVILKAVDRGQLRGTILCGSPPVRNLGTWEVML